MFRESPIGREYFGEFLFAAALHDVADAVRTLATAVENSSPAEGLSDLALAVQEGFGDLVSAIDGMTGPGVNGRVPKQ